MQSKATEFSVALTDEFRDHVPDERLLALIQITARKRIRRVSEMAAEAGCSRRTMQREFERFALPEPSQWIQIIALLDAMYTLISEPGTTIKVAAKAAQYPDPFTFSNQMKRVLGIRPAAAVADGTTLRALVDLWMKQQRARF